jgi:hypothetical protein
MVFDWLARTVRIRKTFDTAFSKTISPFTDTVFSRVVRRGYFSVLEPLKKPGFLEGFLGS